MHFLLPPLKLRLYTGCRLGHPLSKCIASLKKSKSAKMLRIGVLFISQTLPDSFCACVRNTPKLWRLSLEKIKLVSFSLFLDAFLPRPKMPFTYVVNVYSDMSLSRGGKASKNKLKDTSFIFPFVFLLPTMHIVLLNYINFKNIRAI